MTCHTGGGLDGTFEELIVSIGYEIEIANLLPLAESSQMFTNKLYGRPTVISDNDNEKFLISDDIGIAGECYGLKDPFLQALHVHQSTGHYYIDIGGKKKAFQVRDIPIHKIPHVEFIYTLYKPQFTGQGMILNNFWYVLQRINDYLGSIKAKDARILDDAGKELVAVDTACKPVVPTSYMLLKDQECSKYYIALQYLGEQRISDLRFTPQVTIGTKVSDLPNVIEGLGEGNKDFRKMLAMHRRLLQIFSAETLNDTGYLLCVASFISSTDFYKSANPAPIRHHLRKIRLNTKLSTSYVDSEASFMANPVDMKIDIRYNSSVHFTSLYQFMKFIEDDGERTLLKSETLSGTTLYPYRDEIVLFEYRIFSRRIKGHIRHNRPFTIGMKTT